MIYYMLIVIVTLAAFVGAALVGALVGIRENDIKTEDFNK